MRLEDGRKYIRETITELENDGGAVEIDSCEFEDCIFTHAMLQELHTRVCRFVNCDFTKAKLNSSYHRNSAFINCKFVKTSLFDAEFDNCKMTGSLFQEIDATAMKIQRGEWSYTIWSENKLKGVDFSETRLKEADFYGCDLRKCSFRNADLSGALLTGAKTFDTDLRGANVEGVDFKTFSLKGIRIDINQAIFIAESMGAVLG